MSPTSDHNPILVEISRSEKKVADRRFRFDNSWLADLSLKDVIAQSWSDCAQLPCLEWHDQVVQNVQWWSKTQNKLRWVQKETIKKQIQNEQHTLGSAELGWLKEVWNPILEEEDIRLKQ